MIQQLTEIKIILIIFLANDKRQNNESYDDDSSNPDHNPGSNIHSKEGSDEKPLGFLQKIGCDVSTLVHPDQRENILKIFTNM